MERPMIDDNQLFRVLLIDDAPAMHVTVEAALKDVCEVRCVDNGEKGAEMANQWGPDIIICDMLMPGLNGFETIVQLKMKEETRTVPIILLTGVAEEVENFPALKDLVVRILSKPLDVKKLRDAVAGFLPKSGPINPVAPANPPE
jgi:CheY-like chemotaxis protein